MRLHLKTDFRTRPPRPFKHPNGYYYIRQRLVGRDTWRSLGTKNKSEAADMAYRVWHAQQSPDLRKSLVAPDAGLDMVFAEHQRGEKWQLLGSTKDSRERCWKTFLSWCGERGVKCLSDVTLEVATQHLESRGTKNKTWNNVRSDLAAIFGEVCRRLEVDNPFAGTEHRTVTRGDRASIPYRAFTDVEIKTILNGFDKSEMNHADEWRTACRIGALTGLRFKDVALLTWEAAQKDVITWKPYKTVAKTDKVVNIKVSCELRGILEDLPHEGKYVLPGLAGDYSERHSTKYFARYLKRLKILPDYKGRVGFHSFRIRLATLAGKRGIDTKLMSGVLGHTTEAQTEHYNKASANVDLSFASLESVEKT